MTEAEGTILADKIVVSRTGTSRTATMTQKYRRRMRDALIRRDPVNGKSWLRDVRKCREDTLAIGMSGLSRNP
jgi:hypothetical protein